MKTLIEAVGGSAPGPVEINEEKIDYVLHLLHEADPVRKNAIEGGSAQGLIVIKEEKIDYVLHLLNEADPVRKDIKERKLIILKAHSDKVCLTHGAAVQKIRQFPISAERQLSAAASCVKHSSSRMRLYAS